MYKNLRTVPYDSRSESLKWTHIPVIIIEEIKEVAFEY